MFAVYQFAVVRVISVFCVIQNVDNTQDVSLKERICVFADDIRSSRSNIDNNYLRVTTIMASNIIIYQLTCLQLIAVQYTTKLYST